MIGPDRADFKTQIAIGAAITTEANCFPGSVEREIRDYAGSGETWRDRGFRPASATFAGKDTRKARSSGTRPSPRWSAGWVGPVVADWNPSSASAGPLPSTFLAYSTASHPANTTAGSKRWIEHFRRHVPAPVAIAASKTSSPWRQNHRRKMAAHRGRQLFGMSSPPPTSCPNWLEIYASFRLIPHWTRLHLDSTPRQRLQYEPAASS